MTRVALDTNILVYLAAISGGPEDDWKIERVRDLIAALSRLAALVVPVQALGELFVVMRRSGASAESARGFALEVAAACEPVASDFEVFAAAAALAAEHRLQFWDAMIVSAAAQAGCALLLSEDMQNGFAVRGITVINPLTPTPHPLLAELMAASGRPAGETPSA